MCVSICVHVYSYLYVYESIYNSIDTNNMNMWDNTPQAHLVRHIKASNTQIIYKNTYLLFHFENKSTRI